MAENAKRRKMFKTYFCANSFCCLLVLFFLPSRLLALVSHFCRRLKPADSHSRIRAPIYIYCVRVSVSIITKISSTVSHTHTRKDAEMAAFLNNICVTFTFARLACVCVCELSQSNGAMFDLHCKSA